MIESVVAWREVAARLQPFIARRVPVPDVDDVLQDVLLRMHRGLGALRDEDRFAAWMFRVAKSAIADRSRDRGRYPVVEPSELPEVPSDEDDNRIAADALVACLTIFVTRLDPPYREAVTLIELEDKTAREAAELVGISISGMKSRVQRGRAQLRTMLEACCEIAVDPRGKVTDVEPRRIEACCPPSAPDSK